MKISLVLDNKGSSVATIKSDATVSEAVTELGANHIGALVVSNDGEHIDGIVSERDIVRGLADARGALLLQSVESIMTSKVFTCGKDDEVESLMEVMTERRFRHVPVVEEGRLCGIISIGDVVKSRIGELEKDRRELVDYINAR